jgi:hypothetical protein
MPATIVLGLVVYPPTLRDVDKAAQTRAHARRGRVLTRISCAEGEQRYITLRLANVFRKGIDYYSVDVVVGAK